MLKISKISKVILASGLLLVFSAIMPIDGVAYASSGDIYKKCEGKTGANLKKCKAAIDAQRKLDASAGKKDDNDNYVLETKTTTSKDKQGNVTSTKKETTTSKGSTEVTKNKGGDSAWGVTVTQGDSLPWDTALAQKNAQQDYYDAASVAYNKCVAQYGSAECIEKEKALKKAKGNLEEATKNYNEAQKQASKDYYKNEKAQAKAEKAQAKADKKDLKEKEKAYNACVKKNGKDKCGDAEKALKDAQDKVNNVEKLDPKSESKELKELKKAVEEGKNDYEKEVALNNLKAYSENKKQAAAAAEKECARYSAMTSKDAQAKAQAACSQAVALQNEADKASKEYDKLKEGANSNADKTEKGRDSTKAAQGRLVELPKAEMRAGQGEKGVVTGKWIDWTKSKEPTGAYGGRDLNWETDATGADSLAGYRSGVFDYQGSGDEVLDTVTRRAALAIVSLKPIVYIFAGFGLIAFAWMAIFNKLSWKWFANIAMGLFLVANMGRLIEYFVAGDGDYHYYIGKWNSNDKNVGTETDGQNQLANAFKDIYYVYGDSRENVRRGVYEFHQEIKDSESTLPETFKPSAAGFCKGTSASGWANFKNCMQDIVSTAKKVGDTVQTAKATVEDVVSRAESVRDNVTNIVQAAKAMEGASLTDIVANAGTILNNVNAAVSTTTGAVGSIQNGMSSIANNVQDMGKSRAQQQELNDRRAAGEATNKFNAKLSGQEWNESTKGVENVDGQYAGQNTGWSKFAQGAANLGNKTADANNMAQDFLAQTQAVTNVVDNTSVNDLIGDWGQEWGNKTLNDTIKEKAEKNKQDKYLKTNEGKIENYQNSVKALDQLSSDLSNLTKEKEALDKQLEEAKKQVAANCPEGVTESDLCKASKELEASLDSAVTAVGEQISGKQAERTAIELTIDQLYEDALDGHIAKAKEEYKDASDNADKICKKAPSSQECYAARQKAVDAANKMAAYTNEEKNGTQESKVRTKKEWEEYNEEQQGIKRMEEQLKYEQEQDEYRQNNEASIAQQEYSKAMDEANTLYNQINAQEKEVENLEEQAKAKQEEATKICGANANSPLCDAAQTAANAANDAAKNKKDQLDQSKQQYNDAKSKAETAYKNAVAAEISQAEKDYENAKAAAQKAEADIAKAEEDMDSAKADAEASRTAYEEAVSAADDAKSAYDQAVKNKDSAYEIKKLKEDYEAKLRAMNDAKKTRQEAEDDYNELQKKKSEAERAYNDAQSKANEAADRKASYTNESVNNTGDSRLNSSEDIYNQALINQYESETNPNAVAQASRNSYVEYKNKTDMAKSVMNDAAIAEEQARMAYEEALKAAQASGSEHDKKVADRMKKNYELAKAEAETAKRQYEENSKHLPAYEIDYISKAIDSEKYKQEVYSAQMKKASSDINTYERQVNAQRKVVDAAADAYIKAKNQASDSNPDSVKNAAIKYNEYKAAKEVYDDYVKNLNLANTSYSTAQSEYQASLAEVDRLEKQLKELNG